MDIYLYDVHVEEEKSILYECKGRFQENYQQYISYILSNQRTPRKIRKLYRKMSSTQAIQRITNFFDRVSTGSQQDVLKTNDCCMSFQSSTATNKTSGLSTSNEKEYAPTELPDESEETNVEQEKDLSNESGCMYTIFHSDIFPKRETNTDEVNTALSQPELSSKCMLYEIDESSKNCLTQTSSTYTTSSTHEQILPTMQIDEPDSSLIGTSLYQSCCEQLHQIRVYCPKCLRKWMDASVSMLRPRAQRELENYFVQYARLIHRINRLRKTIHRRIKYHCSRM